MHAVDVVAAVVMRRGLFLVQQRLPQGALANLWEFPGGKVEPGETLEEALARECDEELGVQVCVMQPLFETTWAEPMRVLRLSLFWAVLVDPMAEPKPFQAQALAWCTADALMTLDFCPADVPVISALARRGLRFGDALKP